MATKDSLSFFLANTAHYLGQGDIKGLFKYWGQALLQIAVMAVVAIVAPYVLGPLMGLLGGILQGIGSGIIQFGAQVFGSGAIGSFIQAGGAFLVRTGLKLAAAGTKLITQANQFLKDLKGGGFSLIQDSLKKSFGNLIHQLNPITQYKSILKSVTDGVTKSVSGFSRLISNITEKLGVQIAIQKVDQVLEKSKLNQFTKALLSTLSSAGIQAVGRAVSNGVGSFFNQVAGVFGIRAPPINTQGRTLTYDRITQEGFRYGEDGTTQSIYFGLREGDPFGFGSSPVDFSLKGEGVTFGYDTDQFGIPTFAQWFGARIPQIQYAVSQNPDGVSFFGEDGNLFESRKDPLTGRYQDPHEIRLPSGGTPYDPPIIPIKGPFDYLKNVLKAGQGTIALLAGVKIKPVNIPVKFDASGNILALKQFQQVTARNNIGFRVLGINPNAPIHQNLGKYTSVGGSLKSFAKKGLIVGTAVVAFDDILTGLTEGQSRSEIISNVAVDTSVAAVAGFFGALVGAATPLPGLNILIGMGVSTGVSWALKKFLVDRYNVKDNFQNFIKRSNEFYDDFRNNALLEIDIMLDSLQREYPRKNYGFFF